MFGEFVKFLNEKQVSLWFEKVEVVFMKNLNTRVLCVKKIESC